MARSKATRAMIGVVNARSQWPWSDHEPRRRLIAEVALTLGLGPLDTATRHGSRSARISGHVSPEGSTLQFLLMVVGSTLIVVMMLDMTGGLWRSRSKCSKERSGPQTRTFPDWHLRASTVLTSLALVASSV